MKTTNFFRSEIFCDASSFIFDLTESGFVRDVGLDCNLPTFAHTSADTDLAHCTENKSLDLSLLLFSFVWMLFEIFGRHNPAG